MSPSPARLAVLLAGPCTAATRAEVLQLRAAGALRTAADQCAAAELLLGSDVAAEVEAAQALAHAAMAQHPAARRVAATAFDRLRLLAGRPQKFGTQVVVRDGRRVLWDVEPTTTDSERAKWGVPPLAELRRAVDAAP